MKSTILFISAFAFISFTSCSQKTATVSSNGVVSVETKEPNTPEYNPAFEGQTRVKAITTKTPYKFEVLRESLDSPWGITSLNDGRFLITEKEGTMRIIDGAGSLSEKINGLPAVNASGQGGLLGITISLNFAQDRMVYFTLAEDVEGGTLTYSSRKR
jgi:aldose sugar dehydrogenase